MPADANTELMLVLSANISQFQKQMALLSPLTEKATKDVEDKIKHHKSNVTSLFGEADYGKALTGTLARSRFAVLEEGAAKIPIFGEALEELGPAGIAAAAGLAAAGLGLERISHAVEHGADIEKLGTEIGVTTDFIQAFNFAAKQSEIDIGTADNALKMLNENLGAVQANLPRSKRIADIFVGLGISKAQLDSFHDAGDLLPVLADKIGGLSSAAARAGIAQRLGIADLIPMLVKGGAGFDALADKARSLGVVMDGTTVKAAAEAKEKLNELDQVMSAKTDITFAHFAGTLVAIKSAFDAALISGLKFVAALTGTTPARDVIAEQTDRLNKLKAVIARQGFKPLGADAEFRDIAEKLRAASATLRAEKADAGAGTKAAAGVYTPPPGKAKKSKTAKDDAETAAADAAKTLDDGTKAYLDAQAKLIGNIQARADLEKKGIDDALLKKGVELQTQRDKITNDKALSAKQKTQLTEENELARMGEQRAAAAKKELIDRKAAEALAAQDLALRKAVNADYNEIRRISAQSAHTAAERLALDMDALKHAQADQLAELKQKLAKQLAGPNPEITQSAADEQIASLRDLQAAQRAQLERRDASPGQAFADRMNQQYGGSLTDQFQGIEVSGVEQLGDALDKLILKTGKAREVWHQLALSIASDLLKLATKTAIERPLANVLFPGSGSSNAGGAAASNVALTALASAAAAATIALRGIGAGLGIGGVPAGGGGLGGLGGSGAGPVGVIGSLINLLPHFAGGTDDAPGGLSLVGENGPELVNLNPGAQVLSNSLMRGMGAVQAVRASPGRTDIHYTVHLAGANGDQTIREIAGAAAYHAFTQAVATSRQYTLNDAARSNRASFRR